MKVPCVIFFCLFLFCESYADSNKLCELAHVGDNYQFPKDFSFGVSSSAYQIEGAWNRDGRAPSVWDTYTHTYPEMIDDHSNADVTAESYDRFDQDLAKLKELKVNSYRMSISWSRVLPNVTTVVKNQKAIDYYNRVIDSLLANNIKPIVTMHHFDTPEELNKSNSFLNSSFIEYFQTYADFLFETFGDRVKTWITFNEPFIFCEFGFGIAVYPPVVHSPGVGTYICMDNTLRAHAKTYRLYREKYFDKQRGKIGLATVSRFFYKKNKDTPDEVFERAIQYELGWLNEPILGKTGNYPSIMIADIGNNSLKEGFATSRLPVIDEEWSEIIKGSADFLGLNYYTSIMVETLSSFNGDIPSVQNDLKVKYSVDEKWKNDTSDFIYCVPEGLEDILKWIRDNYDNVEVIITENGWPDRGQLNDTNRIEYLQAHLQAVLNAINAGCNVTHYSIWSFIDGFEWHSGYTQKFGLFSMNMTSENKDRVIRESAKFYTNVIESRYLTAKSGSQSHMSYFATILLSIFIAFTSML